MENENLANELLAAIHSSSGAESHGMDNSRMGAFEKGGIWWVDESLWSRHLPAMANSGRKGHPGLCVRMQKHLNKIPFLLGTSKSYGPDFPVVGLTSQAPTKVTHFGRLLPFGPMECAWPHEKIYSNRNKPRLDDKERADLDAFLVRRGLQ